jgi:hypothetical protein
MNSHPYRHPLLRRMTMSTQRSLNPVLHTLLKSKLILCQNLSTVVWSHQVVTLVACVSSTGHAHQSLNHIRNPYPASRHGPWMLVLTKVLTVTMAVLEER